MADVTITGSVLGPGGAVPTGVLEFTAVAAAETTAGVIKVPKPARVTIGALGAVSATLEAGAQYDVAAILSSPTPGRYSLGRWTAPASGAFTNPSLFDAWRTTLAAPKSVLRAVSNFASCVSALTKTPKRTALDVWTMTPYMARRLSPLASPMALEVPVCGNAAGTAGDTMTFSRGSVVSGVIYDNFDPHQGGVFAVFRNGWAASDARSRILFTDQGYGIIQKLGANALRFVPPGVSSSCYPSCTGWALGGTHGLAGRWDCDNPVSGAAYIDAWLDNAQTTGNTAPWTATAPGGTFSIGSLGSAGGQAWDGGALVLCVTSYVPSAAELTAFYNGGAYASPDRFLLHPEETKALFVPGIMETAVVMGSGTWVAPACRANHQPYNSGTNPGGDRLLGNGTFETEAHLSAWTPTNAVLERIGRARDGNGSGQYFANAAAGAIAPGTNDFSIFGCVYVPSLSAAANYWLFCWGSAGAGNDGILIYLNANGYLAFQINDGSASGLSTSASVPANIGWNTFAVTFDRDGLATLYLNNASVGSASIAARAGDITPAGSCYLWALHGASVSAAGRWGRIGFWSNKLLSSGDMTALHNSGKGLYCAELSGTAGLATGLGAYWNGNEESGNAADDSGAGITMTAYGSPTAAAGPDVVDLAGLFGTSALKLINTGAFYGQASTTITGLTAGDGVHIVGWGKTLTANMTLQVYSGTSGTPLTTKVAEKIGVSGGTVGKASFVAPVLTGHDRLTFILVNASSGAPYASGWDNIRAWKSLVANGSFDNGAFAKTGSAIVTSSAGTTVADLGGGVYRITDGSPLDLSAAVAGMIGEWHDGSGFISVVNDGSDFIEVGEITGNPPDSGDTVAVYSALAPGNTAYANPGAPVYYWRATGRTGSYAQGMSKNDANGGGTLRTIVTVSGQWYLAVGWVYKISGAAGKVGLQCDASATAIDRSESTGVWEQVSFVFRATSTAHTFYTNLSAGSCSGLVDDVAVIPFATIAMEVTPATLANSLEAGGIRMDGADQLSKPTIDDLKPSAGTIIIPFTPLNWNGTTVGGNNTILHIANGSYNSGMFVYAVSGRIHCTVYDATGLYMNRYLDVDAASLPVLTKAKLGIRWGASGYPRMRLNTTDATLTSTNGGTGTMRTDVDNFQLGWNNNNPIEYSAESIFGNLITFDRELTDDELTVEMAAL